MQEPLQAGFSLQIENKTFIPGGGGSVNVWISSDSPQFLSEYAFQFAITPRDPGGSELRFVNPQSDPQLSNSEYVFDGNSFKQEFGLGIGNVSSVGSVNDIYTGFDTISDINIVPTISSRRLLATLQFESGPGLLGTREGDLFDISLVPGSFTDFGYNDVSVEYSSMSGVITVTAIPEPGTLTLVAVGALGVLLAARKRLRRQA